MKQHIVKLLSLADRLDSKGFYREANNLDKCIESLKDLLKIQCSEGNWNYNPYMQGMANGMILSLSIMEDDSNPKFLDAPEKWLDKKASLDFKKASPDYLLADTQEKREQGLSGVDPSLIKGMLFVFPSSNIVSFHNKDCLAPIAIKWMNNMEVVGETLLPKYDGQMVQVTSPSPVNMVLEQFAQLRRSYDYGEGPYSDMQDTKSIQDYLQKRRKKRAALISNASCPHGNKIKMMVGNKPMEYCLDCQELLDNNKENRGDWSKQYFDVNVSPYNDLGAPDARSIDKIDFYS